MNDGLKCECRMPLIWREAVLDEATRQSMMREATLLLAAINQMESGHEIESAGAENRRLDRLEAKLDLALHLLARALEPAAASAPRLVKLGAEGAEWPDRDPPAEGLSVILEIRPSEALPLSLNLVAETLAPAESLARVRFAGLSEELNDALVQFVFRRHRQAIRARVG